MRFPTSTSLVVAAAVWATMPALALDDTALGERLKVTKTMSLAHVCA
jgi:hypothetical protein